MSKFVLLAFLWLAADLGTARAAVLCAKRHADGTFNAAVAIREACKAKEVVLDPTALGLQGPPGPKGDPGSGLTSLAGVPCDTGTPEQPDGRTVVSVAVATGALTLRCVSASSNPLVHVGLFAGPQRCSGTIISLCSLSRFSVQEVDANGVAVAGGFSAEAGHPNLSAFPANFDTRRFASGATVRLRAVGGPFTTGLVPSWTGCDSVAGDVCLLVPTSERTVAVVPVTPN